MQFMKQKWTLFCSITAFTTASGESSLAPATFSAAHRVQDLVEEVCGFLWNAFVGSVHAEWDVDVTPAATVCRRTPPITPFNTAATPFRCVPLYRTVLELMWCLPTNRPWQTH